MAWTLPGVGGEAEEMESPMALSKYDESEGVSVRDEVDAAVDGIPSRAASVDSTPEDATPTLAVAFELTLPL